VRALQLDGTKPVGEDRGELFRRWRLPFRKRRTISHSRQIDRDHVTFVSQALDDRLPERLLELPDDDQSRATTSAKWASSTAANLA
jgi:hypothetical protein